MSRLITTILALGALLFPLAVSRNLHAQTTQFAGSQSCRDCHEKFYGLWSTSHHGLAMQPYTSDLARTKLTPQKDAIVAGKLSFEADLHKGVVIERRADRATEYPIVQAMGGKNVFYFLTPLERGFLQVLPVAYDVRRKEWLDTTASAMRHFGDRRDEALYWKERPLTFNTSCFSCHVSQLSRNYDLATDTYHTTWAEPGINCETCHGPSSKHVETFRNLPATQPSPADMGLIVTRTLTKLQRDDMCAPCHAKMSPVTSSFSPGDRYFDHFDLVGLENADFYPDGRDLGENYTYTQWRMNPCAKSGQLECIHCHTSSGRYRFKDADKANNACLPCHDKIVQSSAGHTKHKPGTEADRCIACHMPMTEFARMKRSDHSFRPPAPASSLVYKSPNACNLCHTDKDAAWSDKFVRQWRKRDYQKLILEQAALIDAARKGEWTKLPEILAYLARPDREREEIVTVSLIRLLANCPSDEKWPAMRRLMDDSSPLVRGAAAEALGGRVDRDNAMALIKATGDDYRLVRVRAATALAGVPDDAIPEQFRALMTKATAETIASMSARPDDMGSHYNLGNYHLARRDMVQAAAEFQTATRLQPDALPPYVNAAIALSALGQNEQAEVSLRNALRIDPNNPAANLNLGMLLAELGKLAEAEQAFRAALKNDPRNAQAAYNLAVILASDHPAESLDFSRRSYELGPQNPQYGYTYAFYLAQTGQTDKACETLRAVLQQHPTHRDSAILQQRLLKLQDSPR